MTSIEPTRLAEQVWYYKAPKWYSRWRGGSFYCVKKAASDKLKDHVRDALTTVKDGLNGSYDIQMSTIEPRTSYTKYIVTQVWCKDKASAIQFKLSFCDQ